MKGSNLRSLVVNGAAAAACAAVAAGIPDCASILKAFAAPLAPTGAAAAMAEQLRWAAGVAAAFFILRGAGSGRSRLFARAVSLFERGTGARWAAGIFGVALLLRVGYAAFAAPPPISDEGCYARLATSLAAGAGYAENGVPTAYWPVGYAAALGAFFSAFGQHYFPFIMFQCLLGAGTAALIPVFTARFGLEARGRAAGLIVALCPSQVAYAARLFPAVFAGFMVLLAAYLVIRGARFGGAAAAGLVVGVLTFVLPAAAFLPGVFFATDLMLRRGWARALGRTALAAAVTAAVVAPWTYRNWRAFGAFVPVSTNGGVNLWIGNNPHASGAYYYPTSRTNPLFIVGDELERDRLGRRLAFYFISHNADRFVLLMVPKSAYTFGADVSAFQLEASARGVAPREAARFAGPRVAQTYWALLGVGFLLGLRAWGGNRSGAGSAPTLPLGAVLIWPAYFAAVYLVFFGQDRFHFPAVPFLALVAAAALVPTLEE